MFHGTLERGILVILQGIYEPPHYGNIPLWRSRQLWMPPSLGVGGGRVWEAELCILGPWRPPSLGVSGDRVHPWAVEAAIPRSGGDRVWEAELCILRLLRLVGKLKVGRVVDREPAVQDQLNRDAPPAAPGRKDCLMPASSWAGLWLGWFAHNLAAQCIE